MRRLHVAVIAPILVCTTAVPAALTGTGGDVEPCAVDPPTSWECVTRESVAAAEACWDSRPDPGISFPESDLESGPEPRPWFHRNLFARFASDQAFLWTRWLPREIQRPAFTAPLAVSLAGAAASTNGGIDVALERRIHRWNGPVFKDLTQMGDGAVAAAFLGATFLTSKLTHYERGQRAASLSAEALLSTGLYVSLLKSTVRRLRPPYGQGDLFVYDPLPGQETTSFPSGHAAGAFTVATVFAHEYRDKRWLVWTVYGTAGLIALSRVALGRHFPADVIAGAVIGNSIGRMVAVRGGLGKPDAHWTSRLWPVVDPTTRTVALTYRYSW